MTGPLWQQVLDRTDAERLRRWFTARLPEEPARVDELCVPVACWVLGHLRRSERRPLMIGISAPQGAGKTTLTRQLVDLLRDDGHQAVTVSIDDFYLTRAEQLALAARHPGNRALEHRGFPGTHDIDLGARTLSSLRKGERTEVPRYEKSAHQGRGDRSSEVTVVPERQAVVLLEGWMLGFQPVPAVADELAVSNQALAEYRRWTDHLDLLIRFEMKDARQVVRWRIEAEQAMRASGKPGLTDAEVEDYVRRFLPAYETWKAELPLPMLRVRLDERRLPC